MTTDQGPQFGRPITDGERRRDAVHIAVAPVTAGEDLRPGQHVGLLAGPPGIDVVGTADHLVGIVDPFLIENVRRGQRFWLFVYPGTITGLRHVWKHPAFSPKPAVTLEIPDRPSPPEKNDERR